MDIGTGIAVAGAWIFAGMVFVGKSTTNVGAWVGLSVAITVTAVLI